VLLSTRLQDVAKFTTLTPLPSLLSFALKSPTSIFVWYLGKCSQSCSNSSYKLCSKHHYSAHLVHAHSEQRYYTSDLSELHMTSYLSQTLHSYLLILFCGVKKKILFPIDAVRLCNIFPRYLVNDTIFENNVLSMKCVL